MSQPIPPPGLYTEPELGTPSWFPSRPVQASDPTVLTTGQVIPRHGMQLPGGAGDAFSIDLDAAPQALRNLYTARDELRRVRVDAIRLGQVDPGSDDEVSRDAAAIFGAVATGGPGSLLEAVDGGIDRLGGLIDALEAELAAYRSAEQESREGLEDRA